LTDETIVLLTGGGERRVLSTYDFQGRLINKRPLRTSHSVEATLNRSKTHYLLRTHSNKLNKCQFFIVSARGEFLWESQKTKGWTYRPSLIPLSGGRWLVADGPQCFVLDGRGNQLFEYTAPTEKKVVEKICRIGEKINIEVPGSSMPLDDHYSLLGIEPTQNKEIIKKAYHSKALQWHPDRNPDNPQALEMMKVLNRVYSELIKSPISLSKRIRGVTLIIRYKVILQDHFISAIVDPEGEECWLTSSYGLIYSFKQNTLTQVYSLKQRARILGLFEHDRSLLIEQGDGLYIYCKGQLQQVSRGVGYGYRVLYDPLNRYLILRGNNSHSLCFVDEKGRLGEVKFEHPVEAFDYNRKQNLITVVAGKIYFLRLRRSKKLVEAQVTGDLVARD
jgi:hypothetical protein